MQQYFASGSTTLLLFFVTTRDKKIEKKPQAPTIIYHAILFIVGFAPNLHHFLILHCRIDKDPIYFCFQQVERRRETSHAALSGMK
jgi:hypothetical protein